ncbi:MAG: hypothetical protein WCI74_16250, partial [Actinomycetes bacterium]
MVTQGHVATAGDAHAVGDVVADERAEAKPWLVRQWFLISTVALLAAGIVVYLLGRELAADWLWAGGTVIGLIVSVAWVIEAARARQATVDIIAVLALVGSLIVVEPLAGVVIAVMLATGRALEERSKARAERELRLLVARQPSSARRKDADRDAATRVRVLWPVPAQCCRHLLDVAQRSAQHGAGLHHQRPQRQRQQHAARLPLVRVLIAMQT